MACIGLSGGLANDDTHSRDVVQARMLPKPNPPSGAASMSAQEAVEQLSKLLISTRPVKGPIWLPMKPTRIAGCRTNPTQANESSEAAAAIQALASLSIGGYGREFGGADPTAAASRTPQSLLQPKE